MLPRSISKLLGAVLDLIEAAPSDVLRKCAVPWDSCLKCLETRYVYDFGYVKFPQEIKERVRVLQLFESLDPTTALEAQQGILLDLLGSPLVSSQTSAKAALGMCIGESAEGAKRSFAMAVAAMLAAGKAPTNTVKWASAEPIASVLESLVTSEAVTSQELVQSLLTWLASTSEVEHGKKVINVLKHAQTADIEKHASILNLVASQAVAPPNQSYRTMTTSTPTSRCRACEGACDDARGAGVSLALCPYSLD